MSLPVNNKKAGAKAGVNKNATTTSKFIKTASTKSAGAPKKVRSTGANRGS